MKLAFRKRGGCVSIPGESVQVVIMAVREIKDRKYRVKGRGGMC